MVSNEVKLPEFAQLNVEELNLSTATLISAAPYLGKACEKVNNEFMLCRKELNDPRACIDIGKEVTSCSTKFFQCVKKMCLKEFNQYANCVDKSSGDFSYIHCRKTQEVFDKCMYEKMGMSRPGFGYFTRSRVHSSARKAPVDPPCPCEPVVPDATPSLPDCKPRYPARYGSRFYWMTE